MAPSRLQEFIRGVREGFERGTLKPFPVARHFTLDEAHEAYRLVLSGSTDRVVLRP